MRSTPSFLTNIRDDIASVDFKDQSIELVPFLIFFSGLFFLNRILFGPCDALLGIVFLFFSRSVVNDSPGLSFANYMARVAWFIVMSITATLAGLNTYLLLPITFVYIFVITLLNSDDYAPRNFFWLGLGYLMLLIYPVDIDGVGTRILATLVSLALTSVFVVIMRKWRRHTGRLNPLESDRAYVRRSFDRVGELLDNLAEGIRIEDESLPSRINTRETVDIAQKYARDEYLTVFRQGGVISGRQLYTFALLLCCEQVADMAHGVSKNRERIDEEERQYYRDLARVFKAFGEDRIHSVTEMVKEMENFLSTHSLPIIGHEESWRGILEAMLRTLKDTRMSRNTSTPLIKGLKYRAKYLKENVSFKDTQTRFALQLAMVVTLGMIVSMALTAYGEIFAIWIPVVAFTMMNTYNDETIRSTGHNITGTLLGILVFALCTHFIPGSYRIYFVVLLSYYLILLNISPMFSCIGGTQMALTALYPFAALSQTVITRLLLVVVAVAFVLLIGFVFMHTRRTQTITTRIFEMERIDERLSSLIHESAGAHKVSLWRTVQLMYYMHLNSSLLEELAQSLRETKVLLDGKHHPTPEDFKLAEEVERVTKASYSFAMGAAHAVMLMGVTGKPGQTEELNLDSSKRIRHIDSTLDRADAKMDQFESLHALYDLEEDPGKNL